MISFFLGGLSKAGLRGRDYLRDFRDGLLDDKF